MTVHQKQWAALVMGILASTFIWAELILVLHPSKPFHSTLTTARMIGLAVSILIAILIWIRLVYLVKD